MFSKAWQKSLLCLGVILLAAGCSNFLDGQKREEEVIEFSDDKLSCLSALPDGLKNVSLGKAADGEIRAHFACAQKSLLYFEERTQGSYVDGYSAEDIRKFFGKYFLKENNISPETAKELLKLKKAMFGGSADWISKAEIRRLVDFMEPAQEEVVRLNKHIGLLILQKDYKSLLWPEAVDAVEQLRSSLQNLLRNTDLAKSDYTFDDMKQLAQGMISFVNGSDGLSPYQKMAKWMPLVDAVKRVLIGERAQLGGINDWTVAVNNIVDVYAVFLRYHYVIQHQDLKEKSGVQEATSFGMQAYQLIYGSFQMTKAGQIPFADIDNLINEVTVLFKLPFGLTAGTLKETYRTFVLKMLEPYRKGDTRGLTGLTRTHILSIKREINVWRLTQAFIDSLEFVDGKITQQNLITAYNGFRFDDVIKDSLEQDPLEQEALRMSWGELGILLKSEKPVVFNKEGRYIVADHQKDVPQTWQSLFKVNVIKAFLRVVFLGYGDKNPSEMASAAVSEEALVRAYADFTRLGLEVKAFDPRNANTGARSFKESNFFTFSGNGDARMDYREGFEFFSILISAGLGTSADIVKELSQAGCATNKVDVFGYKMLNESCFKKGLRQNAKNYFNNLQRMSGLISSMDEQTWNSFFGILMRATRISNGTAGLVETADLRTLVVVLHYVDSLLVTYDTNGNYMLSLQEIYGAAPRFLSFLREMHPGNNDKDLAQGLAYLIIYGKKPTLLDMVGFKAGLIFRDPPESGAINLIKAIEVLKDELK